MRMISLLCRPMMMALWGCLGCLVCPVVLLLGKGLMLWLKSMISMKIQCIKCAGVTHHGFSGLSLTIPAILWSVLCQVYKNIEFFFDFVICVIYLIKSYDN